MTLSACWACEVCAGSFGGGCMAGSGDDDFSRASAEQLQERLAQGRYSPGGKLLDFGQHGSIRRVLQHWYGITVGPDESTPEGRLEFEQRKLALMDEDLARIDVKREELKRRLASLRMG